MIVDAKKNAPGEMPFARDFPEFQIDIRRQAGPLSWIQNIRAAMIAAQHRGGRPLRILVLRSFNLLPL
jgi:hypothetical protein